MSDHYGDWELDEIKRLRAAIEAAGVKVRHLESRNTELRTKDDLLRAENHHLARVNDELAWRVKELEEELEDKERELEHNYSLMQEGEA